MDSIISASDASGLPKHERLRNYLLAELAAGRLKPGDGLPTEQELTVAGRMSRNTVRQALAELERNGLIRRMPGRGTFVHESAMLRLKAGLDLFALVIPETRTGYYPSLQRGFHEESGKLHNQVVICDTHNDPNLQASALLQLMDKEVAGIALVPTTVVATPRYQIRPLQQRGIPVVFCHRRVEGIHAPLVTFPALDVGRMAGQILLKYGHKRIALFSHIRGGLSPQYLQGFREALSDAACILPDRLVCCDDSPTFSAAHEKVVRGNLQALMKGKARPTAVFCTFDAEAEVVYLELAALGFKIPEDVSIVGFGGRWRESALSRKIVSVSVDEEELARQAVRLLDEMRRRERPLEDMTQISMPLELSSGETLSVATD